MKKELSSEVTAMWSDAIEPFEFIHPYDMYDVLVDAPKGADLTDKPTEDKVLIEVKPKSGYEYSINADIIEVLGKRYASTTAVPFSNCTFADQAGYVEKGYGSAKYFRLVGVSKECGNEE